jgi:hypothetical protein
VASLVVEIVKPGQNSRSSGFPRQTTDTRII